MTTLTISLPESLKEAFQVAADADSRTASNYFVANARKWLEQSGQRDLRVAEEAEAYGQEQVDEAADKLSGGQKKRV